MFFMRTTSTQIRSRGCANSSAWSLAHMSEVTFSDVAVHLIPIIFRIELPNCILTVGWISRRTRAGILLEVKSPLRHF